ncbi:hypothetical protein ACQY0O_005484 [Thecaphora frezii]
MRLQPIYLAAIQVALVGLVRAVNVTHIPYTSHSQLQETKESLNFEQQVAFRYAPMLHRTAGCDIFPAVFGMDGDKVLLSAGLDDDDHDAGTCRNTDLQNQPVYARHAYVAADYLFVLYACYLPKLVQNGRAHFPEGPRDLWQSYMVLLNVVRDGKGVAQDVVPTKVAWTVDQHGTLVKLAWDQVPGWAKYAEVHLRVDMDFRSSSQIAHFGLTAQVGELKPIILWDRLAKPIQAAFNEADWNRHGHGLEDDAFRLMAGKVMSDQSP